MSGQRKSPNVIYVGDVLTALPWGDRRPWPARVLTPIVSRWRVTAVHPILKVTEHRQPDPNPEQCEREHADHLLITLDTLSRKNGWGLSVRRSATGEYVVTT